jgi:hypothetical protein
LGAFGVKLHDFGVKAVVVFADRKIQGLWDLQPKHIELYLYPVVVASFFDAFSRQLRKGVGTERFDFQHELFVFVVGQAAGDNSVHMSSDMRRQYDFFLAVCNDATDGSQIFQD